MSAIAALQREPRWELVSPEETQDGKEYPPSHSHQTEATTYGEPWENSGCENTGYCPQIAEVYIKGLISVSPEFCIFPYIEKR